MKLSELEKAATPAPWVASHPSGKYIYAGGFQIATFHNGDEGNLSAAARNALPDLLDLLEDAKCPNEPKSHLGDGCIGGKIQRYFHRDGAHFGDEPCPWCAKRAEILEGE